MVFKPPYWTRTSDRSLNRRSNSNFTAGQTLVAPTRIELVLSAYETDQKTPPSRAQVSLYTCKDGRENCMSRIALTSPTEAGDRSRTYYLSIARVFYRSNPYVTAAKIMQGKFTEYVACDSYFTTPGIFLKVRGLGVAPRIRAPFVK